MTDLSREEDPAVALLREARLHLLLHDPLYIRITEFLKAV